VERLQCVASSPDGRLLAGGGASGSLHLWDVTTGALLASWPAHYKAVAALAFPDGGALLLSGGEDTMVAVWALSEVLDAAAGGAHARVAPLHAWSDHTLPVTAVACGLGGASALVATGSQDRTVKLWALASGALLRTVALPSAVLAVALDAGEHALYAGCADGAIYEVSLLGGGGPGDGASGGPPSAAAAAAAGAGADGGEGFTHRLAGHTRGVNALAVSPDGECLVSGSDDGSVRVWDLRSRQQLRSLPSPGKAPVTAALVLPWPEHLSGVGQGATAGERRGPKRPAPLAPLAKYAAAGAPGLKPGEGAPVVLDGSLAGEPSLAAAAGLLPAAAAADAFRPWDEPPEAPTAAAGPSGGGDAPAAAAQSAEVVRLRQQLAEATRSAEQWRALHAELSQAVRADVGGG
jgi:pre-rRNA-processing protein IPI3